MSYPLASIIITGLNEIRTIRECIRSIFEQNYPNFELIFVDGRSTDGTYQVAEDLKTVAMQFPNCKRYIVLIKDGTAAEARNFGVENAQGSLIAFTDADCIADKNWVENLVRHLKNNAGIAGGPNILRHFRDSKTTTTIDRVLETYLGSGGSAQFLRINKITEVKALPACNLAIQRELFQKVGGFDSHLKYNEDTDLCKKVSEKGHRIIYAPDAKVYHFMGLDSYTEFTGFIKRYGTGRGRNAARNPKLLTKFNYFSLSLGVFLILLVTLSSFFSYVLLALIFLIGAFCIIIFGQSILIALRAKSFDAVIFGPLLYISIYFIYNVGFIKGYFSSLKE